MMKDKFTARMFYRFLIPSGFASLALSCGNIVDALVVGNRMGEQGLAAMSLALPVYMVFNVFDIGIAVGGSLEYSRLLGAGKAKKAKRHFNQMFMAALFVGILFAVLGNILLEPILLCLGTGASSAPVREMTREYVQPLLTAAPLFFLNFLLYYFIRCDDDQRLASVGFVAQNIVDVTLNYVFVIVMDLGVKGAVWSTIAGLVVSLVIFTPHLFIRYNILGFMWVRPNPREMLGSFRLGFSTSNQYALQFLFILLANYLLLDLCGTSGVAVFDVVLNVSYVALFFFEAVQNSLQPLASTFHGERNYAAVRTTLSLSLTWSLGVGAVVLVLIALLAENIALLFGLRDYLELGIRAIRIYCTGALFAGLNSVISSYYQALELAGRSFLIALLRNCLILLPTTFLLGKFGTEYSFWYLYPITEILAALCWGALALSRRGLSILEEEQTIFSRTIANQNEDIGRLIGEVEEFCDSSGADMKQTIYVTMAVEEVCSAIMHSAFTGSGEEYIQITLIAGKNGRFELHIRDNARDFNPFDMKTRRVRLSDDADDLDGLGILMVKNKAKSFFYRRYQGFNTLSVTI